MVSIQIGETVETMHLYCICCVSEQYIKHTPKGGRGGQQVFDRLLTHQSQQFCPSMAFNADDSNMVQWWMPVKADSSLYENTLLYVCAYIIKHMCV